jgi:uncharacterized protein YraI
MEGAGGPERRGTGGAPAGGAGAPPPPELEPSPAAPSLSPAATGGLRADLAALLRNRFILFGLSVLVVLLLVTIVLVVVGNGDDNNNEGPAAVVPTVPTGAATEVAPLVGLPGRLRSDATVRNGPGLNYNYVGLIPKGELVPVVGRNEDATWLQVLYPATSQFRGWVIASEVDVDGDISTLVLAGPGAGPQVPLPTSFPFITPAAPVEETPAPPAEEEPTATEERPTRTPVPSATRYFISTSTPVPPQATPSPQR